ncbi:hypothetical protein N5915_01975 [Arcobacter lacus]|uniref:hypothetical protein n=1 Tax=Arcobacter lacus TaxID=1912876 RepID=UPI0021BB7932|nr:hypothetical protein [Arcobacter lacus]MCT7908316.1 hypothetical protein [Arcobacter lacus]
MENKNNEQKTSQEIASDVTKKESLVRNIVVKTTEFLIPIVFWIGIVTIFVISVITVKKAHNIYVGYRFSADISDILVTFTVTFVPSILAFIVSFYLLFLLKDIRDSLQK